MIAVDTRGTSCERHVIRITNELDDDILLVTEILEALSNAFDKPPIHLYRFCFVTQRRYEVLHTRTAGMPIDIPQLADGLHAAHFDS